MVTILEQVRALVERLAPEPICDGCVSERLSLTPRQRADHLVRELAGSVGFERKKDTCAMCGSTKLVIRKKLR